jgi:enoyl-CoA hydratase
VALPETIQYERRDHVAIITINRPDAMNSLTLEMLLGIEEAFNDFNDDDDAWVAILTATGEKAFSSGLDLKEAAPMLTGGDEMGFADHTKRQFSDVFKPIICAVNGFCIAGGMEMMLGTDIRIASDHATFGLEFLQRVLDFILDR